MRTAVALLVIFGASLGCSAQPTTTAAPLASAPPPAVAPAPPAASSAGTALAAPAPPPDACGELGCRLFDTPEGAFRAILETKPLIIAVGEAHAQKGTESIPSSARRFTGEILPLLAGQTSDLLVELMAPPSGCKKTTEVVQTKQKVVTDKQAGTNQNEYVVMGNEARKRGIVPDLLRPSCADLDAIDKAGDEAIGASLATIARLTKAQVEKLLDRNEKASAEKIIATYGGAMHNDLAPPAERAGWSFGPDLSARVKGRYVEIDMFVPEFIQDTASWKKLAWYPHFDRDKHPDKTTLFNPSPGSYVLIFPRAAPRAAGDSSP